MLKLMEVYRVPGRLGTTLRVITRRWVVTRGRRGARSEVTTRSVRRDRAA